MTPNVCYPNFANQATPTRFGALWNPCDLRKNVAEKLSEADQCLANEDYREAHECVQEQAGQAGLKYLGAGIHRAGFAFDGCVVKIAINSDGLEANRAEYEAWQQVGRRFKNIFAPVHDHDKEFLWITQPRLVPIGDLPHDRQNRRQALETRLKNKMKARGLDCGFDVRQHNIGIKAGGNDPFLYDFGFGLSCKFKTSEGIKTVEVKGAELDEENGDADFEEENVG